MWKHRGVRHQLLLSVHPVMTAASIGFVRERIYACRLFRARLLSISRALLLLFLVVLWHHLGYLRLVVKSIFAIFCPKPSPILFCKSRLKLLELLLEANVWVGVGSDGLHRKQALLPAMVRHGHEIRHHHGCAAWNSSQAMDDAAPTMNSAFMDKLDALLKVLY